MSVRQTPVTVALIDPLWIGHHPMYFSQFTSAFLKAGARVIGLCPQPEAATREAIAAGNFRGIPDVAPRISMHLLPAGKRSLLRDRYEGDPVITFQRWQNAANMLADAEAHTGWKADLLYFPYLDSYLRFLPLPSVADHFSQRPWSGLYLRNHHHAETGCGVKRKVRLLAKGDALIRSRQCLEVGVLDERFNEALHDYTGKSVVSYPDATITDLPAEPTDLARQILHEARGRKIIGLIGLERRKGLMTILRVALRAHEEKLPWFFVCGGTFNRFLFNSEELALIDEVVAKLSSGEMDNLHFHPGAPRIPTDADFNSLFTTFDIAWTAYEGFHGSSGALSKAACFDIPALATTGECIGDRVETWRIGLTIPEANVDKAVDAIRHLLAGQDWNSQPLNPRYEEFRNLHSLEHLDQILAALVAKVTR